MIARMNLKRSQRILSKRRSDSSKEKKVSKKPFVNLQLTYYYLLIRQTGRLYSTILQRTGYHIRRKKRLPTALKAAWNEGKERLYNQKAKALVLPSVLLGISVE